MSNFNISAECVKKAVNCLKINSIVENLPRSRRSRKTTVRQNCMTLREMHKNRNISSKQLKSELNLLIKETQIRMRIKEGGYCEDGLITPIQSRSITDSGTNLRNQQMFTKQSYY